MEQVATELEWQNKPELDSDLNSLLEEAELQVLKAAEEFRVEARQEIDDLRARLAVVAHLRHPPIEVRKNCYSEVIVLAQHFGDVMASYGCQLGTDVAKSLKDLVEMAPDANKCLARAIEMHLLVLDNILKEGLCGDGGGPGCEIMGNLHRISALAVIVDCPDDIDVVAI